MYLLYRQLGISCFVAMACLASSHHRQSMSTMNMNATMLPKDIDLSNLSIGKTFLIFFLAINPFRPS